MNGIELIAVERQRQVDDEGWSAEHDADHDCGELAMAAVCYAAVKRVYKCIMIDGRWKYVDPWPFKPQWDKRHKDDRIRHLVKAGALIAAEIDRLKRDA